MANDRLTDAQAVLQQATAKTTAQPGSPDLTASELAAPVNIWSGAKGLAGALTNMTERARERGNIQRGYPVALNSGVVFADSEAAYQALKREGNADYNDALMVDILAKKFQQHPSLLKAVQANGGQRWLESCSHFTGAKSARFQAWEGTGVASRFIRNLRDGYAKAVTGRGAVTRVVHVLEAPFDVYIGRAHDKFPESPWHNPFPIGRYGSRDEVVERFAEHVAKDESLLRAARDLQGLTLGCWCKSRREPDNRCHGDVWAMLAEGKSWTSVRPVQGTLF